MFPIDIAAMVAAATLVFGGGTAALLWRPKRKEADGSENPQTSTEVPEETTETDPLSR